MNEIKPALGINIKDYDPQSLLGTKTWRITEKIDGVRRIFYKDYTNNVHCYSRSGKQDYWLDHICEWLTQPEYPSGYAYDCELVDRMSYFMGVDSFLLRTETNSKAAEQFADNKGDLIAICFDMFKPDGDMMLGKDRTELLLQTFLCGTFDEPIWQINILGYIHGYDENTINLLMDKIHKSNGEGLMLMNVDAPYISGRSKDLVKVKRLEEYIGTVINYDLGRNDSKIHGGISALICRVEGCTNPVRVGTGFTLEMRREMATDAIIGSNIEIEAFGRSIDQNGETSLSMPVFKGLCGI